MGSDRRERHFRRAPPVPLGTAQPAGIKPQFTGQFVIEADELGLPYRARHDRREEGVGKRAERVLERNGHGTCRANGIVRKMGIPALQDNPDQPRARQVPEVVEMPGRPRRACGRDPHDDVGMVHEVETHARVADEFGALRVVDQDDAEFRRSGHDDFSLWRRSNFVVRQFSRARSVWERGSSCEARRDPPQAL